LSVLLRREPARKRDLVETTRELLVVLMRAILLRSLGLAFLGEMLELPAGRLDGKALRQQVVAGIAVGDILDVTGPAETGDFRFEDDAHAKLGGGGRLVERRVLLAPPELHFPGAPGR